MSDLLRQIKDLVKAGEVRISEHGYDELAEDGLTVRESLAGLGNAVIVEEYLDYPKGPCILVLQRDHSGGPVHVVWGVPKGHDKPIVLVTAYRPDPELWDKSFLRRR